MKKIILLAIQLLLFHYWLNGQIRETLLYDSSWRLTTRDNASFFRNCLIDTANQVFIGPITDHYSNGAIEMKGQYYNGVKTDTFTLFYRNGIIESKGLYVNNARYGEWTFFYPNGQLKQIVKFSNQDYDYEIKEYYDSLGNSLLENGTGLWGNSYQIHDLNMWIHIVGRYKEGKRHGKWEVHTKHESQSEKTPRIEKFKNGELQTQWYTGTFLSTFFPDKYKIAMTEQFKYSVYVSKKDYPFIKELPETVDSLKLPYSSSAHFPGGEKELRKFIRENLNYPKEAKNKGIEAYVFAEFMVNENGDLTEVTIPEFGYNRERNKYGFQKEVALLFQKFPNWIPATRNGKNVKQIQILNIHFNVDEIQLAELTTPNNR